MAEQWAFCYIYVLPEQWPFWCMYVMGKQCPLFCNCFGTPKLDSSDQCAF